LSLTSFITILVTFFGLMCSTAVSARPLAVFSGGFGSCAIAGSTGEIKSSAEMDQFTGRLRRETGDEPVQVRTCYAIGSESTIYVTAVDLGIVDEAMTRDEFYDVVRSAAELAGESAPVYVWGQSHGGWTAMSLVVQVSDLNYRMLTTVDPISIPDCGPVVFSGGVITGSSDGCRRAPKDLEEYYPLISERVENWSNWYQVDFSLLHSSEISHAHANHFRHFDADWWVPMGSHSLTERDPMMWQSVTDQAGLDARKFRKAH